MTGISAVAVVIVLVLVAWLVARVFGRMQARMRGEAPDLRRSGDGGDPPFDDWGRPMG